MPSVSGIPIKQIDAAFLTGRAVSFFVGLWCNWTARRSPKLQISVQVRTDLLWLYGVKSQPSATMATHQALNTSGSQQALITSGSQQAMILRPQVQFPRGLLMGYSYNGYYARLLICEIRVRVPTGLLKCFDISYCRVAR